MTRPKIPKNSANSEMPRRHAASNRVVAHHSVMNAHSGTPEITIQQWAILLRCKSEKPVSIEAIIRCAMDWFTPSLSMSEVTAAMDALILNGWLAFNPSQQTAQATSDGVNVANMFIQPIGMADAWNSFAPGWIDNSKSEVSDRPSKGPNNAK